MKFAAMLLFVGLLFTAAFGLCEAADTVPIASDTFTVDFSSLLPDNPAATPVSVDPIDKPTPTPMPTPNYAYTIYENTAMGISFAIPFSWLLNPNTNQTSAIQFVEPQSEIMDEIGYQTRITIERVNMGVPQTVSDARTKLETTLEELSNNFTSFVPGSIASATLGGAKGSYCYYKAEYNDGTKTYLMNGRITIVAYANSLYQVRLTAPRAWYSYYENVFRRIRTTWKFL
ncbi:MAG: hypothetical protein IJ242_06115 [Clostridia bacterium]|nr:hypothetical protein [Clostridia bacterium]